MAAADPGRVLHYNPLGPQLDVVLEANSSRLGGVGTTNINTETHQQQTPSLQQTTDSEWCGGGGGGNGQQD